MSKTTAVDEGLLAWLASEDCLPWLAWQARAILRTAGDLGLPANLWPYPPGRLAPPAELSTATEEVAHEFWLFIRAALERRSEPLPQELGAPEMRAGLLGAYFRNGFINHLRSLARRKEISLYHYLYRRVREAVTSGPGCHYRNGRHGVLYSLEPEGRSLHALLGLVDTNYQSWPSPMALVNEKDFLHFRLEDLHKLARHFWLEATGRIEEPCFLPCRDLVSYLAEHYQCLSASLVDPQEDSPEASTEVSQQAQVERGALEVLAAQVLPLWSMARRQVFWLSLDPGNLTLQDVAQRTGLSGPSHVKYHLDRACQDLTSFCDSWPGVVPPATDRNFWIEFLHCVAAACKNSSPDR